MTLLDDGKVASVVREGDYLVFRIDRGGVAVEFSPGASAGSPVVGAFAAYKGRVVYKDALEAAEILQNFPLNAEQHLIAQLDRTDSKKKSLTDQIVDALVTYADAGYEQTQTEPKWDGKLSDLHKQVVYPLTGVPYSSNVVKAFRRAADRVPGVIVEKLGDEVFATVHWPEVST